MPAQVSTENSFHRGVLVTYQKFWKCSGTWKNCFKILIKKSSRAPYLFLQNTPRTEYWRIWKSWALMFESYLLIPNGSFCGKRLKNKNKKYAAVQEKQWYWTYSSAFVCVSSKEVLARNMRRAFRSISRFLKDLSDSSGSKQTMVGEDRNKY